MILLKTNFSGENILMGIVLFFMVVVGVLIIYFKKSMPDTSYCTDVKRIMKKLRLVSTKALIKIIKDETESMPERMHALHDAFIYGLNGSILEFGFSKMILQDKETWYKEVNEHKPMPDDLIDPKLYEETMKFINRRLE